MWESLGVEISIQQSLPWQPVIIVQEHDILGSLTNNVFRSLTQHAGFRARLKLRYL